MISVGHYDLMMEMKHWWFQGRRALVADTLRRLEPCNSWPAILDAGCGSGGNLDMLSRFGRVTGMDTDEGALEQARLSRYTNLVQSDISHLGGKLLLQSFQIVVAFDLLEHVQDDLLAAANIAKLLTPAGHAIITVPAH